MSGSDLVTWVMPREEAIYLLRWLRYNRPLGMPARTFDGLMDAIELSRVPSTSEGGGA